MPINLLSPTPRVSPPKNYSESISYQLQHYAAINKYIKQGAMMLDVLMHQPDRPIRSFVDSLQAFWPGLQVKILDLCNLFVFEDHTTLNLQ